ncbi:MAG: PQQ-binding-like beta-propeller repeat protein, partial [Candidatus Zixiibacteriota bacterium]
MKRRVLALIAAILCLSLMAMSTVFGTDDNPRHGLNPVQTINPDAPRFQDLTAIKHSAPSFQKPASEIMQIATPTALLPPTYFCEFIDYSGGAAAYFWRVPDKYGDIEMGMRFTPAADYTCTLLTTYIGIYGSYLGANIGTPDMLVTVYGDDGFGYPDAGNVLGSVVVPFASLPTSGLAYVPVDLSSLGPLVFTDGEEFHIGVSVDNFVDGDTLAMLSDDGSAGLGRSWENWAGLYGFMIDDWGIDINFLIGVDLCCGLIPFTDCYIQEYNCAPYYVWPQPDDYGDDYFNMRFSVEGPETLMEVGVALYAPYTVGTPDLDVFVWGDDGTGFPDLSNEIAKVTIPNASLVYYPNYNIVDLSGLNLVMTGDFHVGWSTNEVSDPAGVLGGISDDGSCGTQRSSEYWNSMWGLMLDDWGVDINFLIYANMCKDQFSNCKWLSDYCGTAYFWRLPDKYGDIGEYQKFSPSGLGCRLENFDVYWYWNRAEYALPLYQDNTELNIYAADGGSGLPGTLLFQKILTPADYGIATPTPSASSFHWASYSGDGFTFDEDIWIGLTSLAADTLHGIRTLSDDGSCGSYRSCETWGPGAWGYMADDWGLDANFIFEAYVCCIAEPPPPVCMPGDQWPTMAHDFGRTNASVSSLGTDVQGNMTKAWTYVQPTGLPSNLNSPVIYGDKVVCYFLDYLACIDLNTGAEIWNKPHDGFHIGSGCYSTPTVYNFADYGLDQTFVFTAGGDAKAFTAFDLETGAIIWTKNFMFHSQHFMTYGPSVIVDAGGIPIIIYSDDNGSIYALEALTGVKYAGWAVNPISLGGAILKGISTDGSVVYVGIDANISNGDIFAVNALTGVVIWQFANQQLCNLNPENCGAEAFTGTIAYDVSQGVPTLFTASSYNQYVDYPPYMSGGIFYSIDASTGALNWAKTCNAQDYNGPALAYNLVINNGWNGWISSGEFRGPVAFRKTNGSTYWANTGSNPGLGPQYLADGIIACGDGISDYYIAGCDEDFLNFFRVDDGAQMFHRRYAGGYKYAHHYSPSMSDGRLLIGYVQKLFCLTEQEPRPRLDLPQYTIYTPVEFGSPDNHTVIFPNA